MRCSSKNEGEEGVKDVGFGPNTPRSSLHSRAPTIHDSEESRLFHSIVDATKKDLRQPLPLLSILR